MKIYLWGTGCGAAEVIEKGLSAELISGFIDSHPMSGSFLGKKVLLPEALRDCEPDLIIVTCRHAGEVAETCRQLGIPAGKLLYIKDPCSLTDRNKNYSLAEELLGKDLLERLVPRQCAVTVPASIAGSPIQYGNDFVRIATLRLLVRRLQEVPGAAAELGVYKGAFSKIINSLMPDRRLYLFDSFEGFRPGEGKCEQEKGTCGDAFLSAHQNTAIETVIASMPYPESVTVMPGYFPDSLRGLEETFCLVSLDADFYETTLEGLRYFWPRLSPGGYLMLHDWDSSRLTGVRQALDVYQRETGYFLPSVPIPDIGGSLIIQKISNFQK